MNRSRFLADLFPVETEQEAQERIAEVRKKYYDARHHCYAFRIGPDGRTARSSDDGEPSGTAGMPILHVLTGRDVTNVLIVVTRYFGGILLGTGGLVRAYGGAASDALDAAGTVRMEPCSCYRMELSYSAWAELERKLSRTVRIGEILYTDRVTVPFCFPVSSGNEPLEKVRELLEGKAEPVWIETAVRPAADAAPGSDRNGGSL